VCVCVYVVTKLNIAKIIALVAKFIAPIKTHNHFKPNWLYKAGESSPA